MSVHPLVMAPRPKVGAKLATVGACHIRDCCSRWTIPMADRKSTRLNSSESQISYAVFCLKKKKASSPSSGSMCDPSHHCLAMFTLRGSDQLVIRDLTDIAHPKTISTAGRAFQLLGYAPALEGAGGQFVSSSEISYLGGQTDPYYALPNTLFRRPISGTPSPVVVRGDKAVVPFVWRPDGSVAYLPTADPGLELHVLSGGRDRVLATLPALAVGGGGVEPCPPPPLKTADP